MKLRHYAALALVVGCAASAQERPAAAPEKKQCLAPGAWYTLHTGGPQRAAADALLREATRRQVVLLGEQHDSADDHAWQLQTLAALHLLRPHMVIGFESFPRRVQPALDRWIAGELSRREFLEQTEWQKVWNMPPELYMPLFEFARLNRIPMVALNVERTLTEAVSARGWDAVPVEQKEGVSRPAAPVAAYEKTLHEVFLAHGNNESRRERAAAGDADFRRFVESQTTWDRAMAEALAARLRAPAGGEAPLAVGIMGSGHVRYGHGVAHQLRDLGVNEVSLLLPVDGKGDCSALKAGVADAVFAAPAARREAPPPPRLGIQLAAAGGIVEITAVTSGSLAEQTGLRRGDRIVAVAGTAVKTADRVVAAIRAQPAGTWLPMQIRRGEETLDIVVRFPART